MVLAQKARLLAGLAATALAAALAAALPLTPAAAATSTTTFAVTAQVSSTCFITATAMDFGPYTGVQTDAQSTVTATCSTGTPYNIGLTQGTGAGATVSNREMTGPGAEILDYTLAQDAAHAIPWGDTIGTDTKASTGTGAAQPFTVFGRLAAGQFVQAGSYSDTVTVTLTF